MHCRGSVSLGWRAYKYLCRQRVARLAVLNAMSGQLVDRLAVFNALPLRQRVARLASWYVYLSRHRIAKLAD